MHARLLALACLLSVSASYARSETIPPAGTDVDLFLKTSQEISITVLDEMRSELALLIEGTGIHLELRVLLKDSRADTISGFPVVVELRGQCGVPWHADRSRPVPHPAPLASTAVADGSVLPFSWVDCAALDRLVGPSIADQPDASRDYIYGRALGRLLAHELYHVLTQTTAHAQTGVAKAQFTAAELLAESFRFEGATFTSPLPKSAAPIADLPAPAESAIDDLEPVAVK
jgi:hypothetical protein